MDWKFWRSGNKEQLDRIEEKVDHVGKDMREAKSRQIRVERRLRHVEATVGVNPAIRQRRKIAE